MDRARDDFRRSAKNAAIASLESLRAAFAGEDETIQRIDHAIDMVRGFDVKPERPAVGEAVVIAEAVAALPAQAAPAPAAAASGGGNPGKRPRRAQAEQQADQLTLDDFPINACEVLLPRVDPEDPNIRWNEYCRVVGHTPNGQLEIELSNPGDDDPIIVRSLASLGTGLGRDSRPRKRACTGAASSSSSALPPPAPEPSSPASTSSSPSPLVPREAHAQSATEQIEATALSLSGGRTRKQLNKHLDSLVGINAKWGQPVVSRRAGADAVSHLTFNLELWNDLPNDASTPFEWWLGEGAPRLAAARLIDPGHRPQPAGGIPVFFAVKGTKGGALCRYGGHYTTVEFKVLSELDQQNLTFKDKERQARILLKLHHFDEALAAAIDAIPEDEES